MSLISFFLPVLHVNKADADKSWTLDEAAQNLSQSRPGERGPRWKTHFSLELIAFDLGALLDRPAVYDVRYDVTWLTPLAKTLRFKVRTASGRNAVNSSLWWNPIILVVLENTPCNPNCWHSLESPLSQGKFIHPMSMYYSRETWLWLCQWPLLVETKSIWRH